MLNTHTHTKKSLSVRALVCIAQTSALHQAPCFKLLHHIYPTQARDAQNVTQHCMRDPSCTSLLASSVLQFGKIFLRDREINIA